MFGSPTGPVSVPAKDLQRNSACSRPAGDGDGKLLQRGGKLFRVKIREGLRELEQLVERRLRRLVVF